MKLNMKSQSSQKTNLRLTTNKDADLVNLIDASVVKKATKLLKNNKAVISSGFKLNALKMGLRYSISR